MTLRPGLAYQDVLVKMVLQVYGDIMLDVVGASGIDVFSPVVWTCFNLCRCYV